MFFTYNQLKITKSTLGLFVSDQVELYDRFILSGGFRQEWADFVFDQAVNAGRYETKRPEENAFDAGVEYKYLEKGAVYGRYTKSFRFPATEEFYSRWMGLNTDLEHQTSGTWEAGLKDRNWAVFQPSVNFFWMRSDHEIYYDPTVGFFGDNRNYDRIKRFGIETGASSDVLEIAQIYFNYTYLDAEFDGGMFDGNKVPMVPEHKIAWGISFAPVEYIELNFNSEYVSEQYSINDQFNRMPRLKPRFVCNGKITAKYKGVKAFFGINNIFDARYSEIAVSNVTGTVTDYFPSPDRNYVFGFSMEI
jgi:iron complex outermembrane receptor protein